MRVIIFQILFNLRLDPNCVQGEKCFVDDLPFAVEERARAPGLHQQTHGLINQNRDGGKKANMNFIL